jgi:hypothetical protein
LSRVKRLIAEHGRAAIDAELEQIRLRRRGRPSRGNLPLYEAMHLASCIDEWAEENRAAGSKKPILEAELEAYEMDTSPEQRRDPAHFARWQKNIKKKRLKGRRELAKLLGPK